MEFENVCDKQVILECSHSRDIMHGMKMMMVEGWDGSLTLRWALDRNVWRMNPDGSITTTQQVIRTHFGQRLNVPRGVSQPPVGGGAGGGGGDAMYRTPERVVKEKKPSEVETPQLVPSAPRKRRLMEEEEKKEEEVVVVKEVKKEKKEEVDDTSVDELGDVTPVTNAVKKRREMVYRGRIRAYHDAYDEVIARGGSMKEADEAGRVAMEAYTLLL